MEDWEEPWLSGLGITWFTSAVICLPVEESVSVKVMLRAVARSFSVRVHVGGVLTVLVVAIGV